MHKQENYKVLYIDIPVLYLYIEEGEAEAPVQNVHSCAGVLPYSVPYLHNTLT